MNKLIDYEPLAKTENVMVRMTKDEKENLVALSQKHGVSISAFIRFLLAGYAGVSFKDK